MTPEQLIERLLASINRDIQHASDCAVHNAPALPVGPCDCGAVPLPPRLSSEAARIWQNYVEPTGDWRIVFIREDVGR
jgi:hypothetical protein